MAISSCANGIFRRARERPAPKNRDEMAHNQQFAPDFSSPSQRARRLSRSRSVHTRSSHVFGSGHSRSDSGRFRFTDQLWFPLSAASCQLPVASCQLPVASCQLPVSGFRFPASSFQLPASGFRFPASSCQLPASRFGAAGIALPACARSKCEPRTARCPPPAASCAITAAASRLLAVCELRLPSLTAPWGGAGSGSLPDSFSSGQPLRSRIHLVPGRFVVTPTPNDVLGIL